jgi:hypothetical protein
MTNKQCPYYKKQRMDDYNQIYGEVDLIEQYNKGRAEGKGLGLLEIAHHLEAEYKRGKAEVLAEVKRMIKRLRKKSDRCSDCSGCNCDLCMLEFVELKKSLVEEKE